MKIMGFVPDIFTYLALLQLSARGGDLPTALLIFDEIQRIPSLSPRMDQNVFLSLLNAYASNQRVSMNNGQVENNILAANKIFERMIAFGITPTVWSLNSLLRVSAEACRINRTKMLYEKFSDYGVVPNKETFKILIKMYSRTRRMDRALDLFYSMKSFQHPIDYKTYILLMDGCVRSHYITSGMRIIKEMKEKGYPLQPHFHFVLNFRRQLVKTPHLIRELDDITGRSKFRPTFLKPGFKIIRARRRELSKEESKLLSKEPKFFITNNPI